MKKTMRISRADAKARLLEAAIRVFALQGYEGASTRLLAKEAKVNISAIPYYFSSKEGLYQAILRHIIELMQKEMGERALAIREALQSRALNETRGRELLGSFIGGLAAFLLSERANPFIAQILIREQMQPTASFNILYEGAMRSLHETVTGLVAFLIGAGPLEPEPIMIAHTLVGQAIIFKTHREVILRRLGCKNFDEARTRSIVQLIRKNADALITAHRKKDYV